MDICIFAGGNQTRFGKTFAEQSKVLTRLPNGETILSHTLFELNLPQIRTITVFVSDKKQIENYITHLVPQIKTNIVISRTHFPHLGMYPTFIRAQGPITFIFGDVYFPNTQLRRYVRKVHQHENQASACLGVSKTRVGDYKVQTEHNRVTNISKEGIGPYFTCGVFTITKPAIIKKIPVREKFTEWFRELPQRGYQVGYAPLKGLIDVDTQENLTELEKYYSPSS